MFFKLFKTYFLRKKVAWIIIIILMWSQYSTYIDMIQLWLRRNRLKSRRVAPPKGRDSMTQFDCNVTCKFCYFTLVRQETLSQCFFFCNLCLKRHLAWRSEKWLKMSFMFRLLRQTQQKHFVSYSKILNVPGFVRHPVIQLHILFIESLTIKFLVTKSFNLPTFWFLSIFVKGCICFA